MIVQSLNRLANGGVTPPVGTWDTATRAANKWAGTTDLNIVRALNVKAGTTGLTMQAVTNVLAGTKGVPWYSALDNYTDQVQPPTPLVGYGVGGYGVQGYGD